jgi:hypothetical protein
VLLLTHFFIPEDVHPDSSVQEGALQFPPEQVWTEEQFVVPDHSKQESES